MDFKNRIKKEIRSTATSMLYFLLWISFFIFLKQLVLKEYHIEFYGMTKVIFGALIASKAIRLLDKVSFGLWLVKQPAIIEIVLRTILYGIGVAFLLLLHKTFESRSEYDSLIQSFEGIYSQINIRHVWVNSVCIFGAFFGWNFLSLLRKYLGAGGVLSILFLPAPK